MTLEGLENKSCEVNRSRAIWKKNNHISLLLNHYLPLEKSIMLKKISYYFRGEKRNLDKCLYSSKYNSNGECLSSCISGSLRAARKVLFRKNVGKVHNLPGKLHICPRTCHLCFSERRRDNSWLPTTFPRPAGLAGGPYPPRFLPVSSPPTSPQHISFRKQSCRVPACLPRYKESLCFQQHQHDTTVNSQWVLPQSPASPLQASPLHFIPVVAAGEPSCPQGTCGNSYSYVGCHTEI